MYVYKEITPLKTSDVFIILNSEKIGFDYPIHYHSDYELTLILNSAGHRIVGDSIEDYISGDLVLIGPEIYHKWDDDNMPVGEKSQAHVITIQFSEDLFKQLLFQKDSFFHIQNLLKESERGLVFTGKTFIDVSAKMKKLVSAEGFKANIDFFKILQILSVSKDKRYLTGNQFSAIIEDKTSERVNNIHKYILEHSKDSNLRITDLAHKFNMSASSFGHFFKKCSNINFTQFLINLRISHASRYLLHSDLPISEIAYKAGFNSIANFNRLFKKYKLMTPKEYRQLIRDINNKASATEFEQNPPPFSVNQRFS